MSANHFKIDRGIDLTPQAAAPANPTNGAIYYDSTLGKFRKYENNMWQDLGSGGGTGINYVGLDTSWVLSSPTDINADLSVGNWAAYADAAGASPVDMTGGSPNVTIARTTTVGEVLDGSGSFKVVKDAANRQGQGVSVLVNIPTGYRATPQIAYISFKIISGSITAGDLKLFAYDVTNATVINLVNSDISVYGSQGIIACKFLTQSTTEQIRLGFHFASTSATAVTFSFDDVIVSPNATVNPQVPFEIPNYIRNGRVEYASTSGYATYADAAAISPVDGTGGSPNVTISTTATNSLSGDNSLLLTKDAANRQGQGWSYDFTIDRGDQAKVMQVTFDYILDSGTFVAGSDSVSSDVTLWIYDVTNGTMMQPSTFKLYSNSSTVPNQFISNFQTAANSTSYRMIWHIGSTSASAYALKVDNISVIRTQYAYGTFIGDWVNDGAVSIAASSGGQAKGGTVIDRILRRKVGDSAEFRIEYRQNSGGTAGTGDYLITLPASLQMDPNKVTYYATITGGAAGLLNASLGDVTFANNASHGAGAVVPYDATRVRFLLATSAGTAGYFSSGFYPLSQTNLSFAASFIVPILGWTSSVQMSDSVDNRHLIEHYTGNAGAALTADVTNIDFTTKVSDSHGAWSGTVFTAYQSGTYNFQGGTQITANSGHTIFLWINGVKKYALSAADATAHKSFSTSVYLNSGDTVVIRSDTGSITLNNSATNHFIIITRSPASTSIAATETIAASYYASANGTTSTTQTINFDTKIYDTHGAVTAAAPGTGTWKFTAPAVGKYRIVCLMRGIGSAYFFVYKNGTVYQVINYTGASNVNSGSLEIQLNAGDFIDFRSDTSGTYTGGTLGTLNPSHVQISRM